MTAGIPGKSTLSPSGASRLDAVDFAVVRRLAEGDHSAREAARAVYDKHLESGRLSNSPEMNFLSEVFAPVPDFLLRANYRRQVLALVAPSSPDQDALRPSN